MPRPMSLPVRKLPATGVEIINVLLKNGADRTLQDMYDKTAVQAASEAGRSECVRALNLKIGDAKVGTPLLASSIAVGAAHSSTQAM